MELVNRDEFGIKKQYEDRISALIDLVQALHNTPHEDEPVGQLKTAIEQYAEYCYTMGTHEGKQQGFDHATDIAHNIITNGSK